jgi:squalene-hopene/tetraprenyl-beta-curcumene cyclase
VSGLEDGQLIEGSAAMAIGARDNHGGGVVKVELDVDDRRVASACGAELSYSLVGAALPAGRHVLDVRATNAKGEVSRRRLEVFTGDTFITQVASRWVSGGTEVSLRNLSKAAHTVVVEIVPSEGGAAVFSKDLTGQQGSMHVRFAGNKPGKYVARLAYRDATGTVRQREELPFVHDTTEKQWASYGQIQGAVALPGGGRAANAEVQLIDDKGNVVARTRSTAAGQYRFKNVDADRKYKVKVEKDGFSSAPVEAAPAKAAEVQADTQLMAE